MQDARDRFAEAVPFGVLGRKLFAPRRSQTINPCAAIVGGGAPFGDDPALLQEPLQRGVQLAVFDLERIAGSLLDELGDAVSVHGPPAQGAQDDEVESALHDFETLGLLLAVHR